MALIQPKDLEYMLYKYQLDEIAENNDDILQEACLSGEAEVRSYFEASNARRQTAGLSAQAYAKYKIYDIDKLFNPTGEEKGNSFVRRLCLTIACWNFCTLSGVDVIHEHLKYRYEATISTLEKIAGMGSYSGSPLVVYGVPTIDDEGENPQGDPDSKKEGKKPFRMGSRPKFHHE